MLVVTLCSGARKADALRFLSSYRLLAASLLSTLSSLLVSNKKQKSHNLPKAVERSKSYRTVSYRIVNKHE